MYTKTRQEFTLSRSLAAAIGAPGAALIMWLLSGLGAGNLHPAERFLVELLLVLIAGMVGFASGSILPGAPRHTHPILFGSTVGAVGGAICGGSYTLLMGIAYVTTFGGAPVGVLDALVVALAYPVFALLGALVGAVSGSVLGAVGAYWLTRPSNRGLRPV